MNKPDPGFLGEPCQDTMLSLVACLFYLTTDRKHSVLAWPG